MVNFRNANILLVGDIILDQYIYGTVDRICPEAPVPVLNCKSEEAFLGGAGIVLTNLIHLGAAPKFVSVAGHDEDARKLERLFKGVGAPLGDVIIENGRKTTIKTRCVATSPFWQMIMRFDKEVVDPISKETEEKIISRLEQLVPKSDLVVVSDYTKGLITGTVRERIIRTANKNGKKVVVDSKGTIIDYKGADTIAPNRVELCKIFDVGPTNDDRVISGLAKRLADEMQCRVVVKRSEKGILWIDNGKEHNVSSSAKTIVNVSGAGDVFIASLALAMASEYDFESSVKIANFAAGKAIGRTRPHVTPEDFNGIEF